MPYWFGRSFTVMYVHVLMYTSLLKLRPHNSLYVWLFNHKVGLSEQEKYTITKHKASIKNESIPILNFSYYIIKLKISVDSASPSK